MEKELHLMKSRILESYKWRKDIIIPLSKEFDVSIKETEELFMDLMDMSTLENLHATFESAGNLCLIERLHIDLRLCWFYDTLELLTKEESDNLKLKIYKEFKKRTYYQQALNALSKNFFQLLKNK